MLKMFVACLSAICFITSCGNKSKQDAVSVEEDRQLSNAIIQLKSSDELSKLICQNWIVQDAEPPMPKDLEGFGDVSPRMPSLFILNDGNVIENPLTPDIRFGKYQFNDHVLNVIFNDGKKSVFTIKKANPLQMTMRRSEAGNETILKLKGDGLSHVKATDNPFHPDYNYWRLKPKLPEDDSKLIQRLKSYVNFYYIYFQDFLNRDAQTMDTGTLPCCFNWYKGGIGIQSEKKLDSKFIDCFHSREQAFKARQILEDATLKKHPWKPNVANWVEQTLPILKSIRDSI